MSKVKKPFSILLAVILGFLLEGWKDYLTWMFKELYPKYAPLFLKFSLLVLINCLIGMVLLIGVINIAYLRTHNYRLFELIMLVLYLIIILGSPSMIYHIIYYELRDLCFNNVFCYVFRKEHYYVLTRNRTYVLISDRLWTPKDVIKLCLITVRHYSYVYVAGMPWTPEVVKHYPKELRQYFIDKIWKELDHEVRKFYSRKYCAQIAKIGTCKQLSTKRVIFIELILKIHEDGLITDSKGIDLVYTHYPVSRFRRKHKRFCPFIPSNSVVRYAFRALFDSPELVNELNSLLKEISLSKSSVRKGLIHQTLFSFLKNHLGVDINDEYSYMPYNDGPCSYAIDQYDLAQEIIRVHCPQHYDLFTEDYERLLSCTRSVKSLHYHYQLISTLNNTKVIRKYTIYCIENEVCKHYRLDQDLTDRFVKLTIRKTSLKDNTL